MPIANVQRWSERALEQFTAGVSAVFGSADAGPYYGSSLVESVQEQTVPGDDPETLDTGEVAADVRPENGAFHKIDAEDNIGIRPRSFPDSETKQGCTMRVVVDAAVQVDVTVATDSVEFDGGSVPSFTLASGERASFTFVTVDGGSTWIATENGRKFA